MVGFLFGGDTGKTYEQVQRQRQIADAMMAQQGTPRNVGEGISSFARQISGALIGRRAAKRDDELRAASNERFQSLFGGGSQPAPTPAAFTPSPVSTPAVSARTIPTPEESVAADTRAALGLTPQGASPEFKAIAEQNIFPGESGGDYDALFGYSNRANGRFGNVRLTSMTVDEALDFSNPSGEYGQFVKGQVGHVATPMGAYQVVGSTLRAAKDGLGLTGNEVMTPELQDRIGEWIYQNQGPSAWEGWGAGGGGGGQVNQPRPQQGGGNPSMQQIVAALSDPYTQQDPGKMMVLQSLLQQAMPQQPELTASQREYEFARSQGFEGSFLDYQTALAEARRTNITNNVGDGPAQPELLGTSGLVAIPDANERTGYRVEPAPGSPAAREVEAEVGAGRVAAEKAAASIEQIDAILNDPALAGITGMVQGRLPPMGQAGTDLDVRIQQLKGQAFLQAFESLKGGGQITEREGQAATEAMARLDRKQSTEAYQESLHELRYIMDRARRRGLGEDVGEYDFRGYFSGLGGGEDLTTDGDGWTTLPNGVRIREVN